jgi:hypothetical protein
MDQHREAIVMSLPDPLNAYDLRTGRMPRNAYQLALELGPVEPVLLALSEEAFAQPPILGPHSTRHT